jgi:hypothetical protein
MAANRKIQSRKMRILIRHLQASLRFADPELFELLVNIGYSRSIQVSLAKALLAGPIINSETLHTIVKWVNSDDLFQLVFRSITPNFTVRPLDETIIRVVMMFNPESIRLFLHIFPLSRFSQHSWHVAMGKFKDDYEMMSRLLHAATSVVVSRSIISDLPGDIPEDIYLQFVGRYVDYLTHNDVIAAMERHYSETTIRYLIRRISFLEKPLLISVAEGKYSKDLIEFIERF